jgi:hypothetical protein
MTTSDNYKFQIRGHTKSGWSSYTEEKLVSLRSISIDKYLSTDEKRKFVNNKNIFLIGPSVILGLVITVIILAFIYSKR